MIYFLCNYLILIGLVSMIGSFVYFIGNINKDTIVEKKKLVKNNSFLWCLNGIIYICLGIIPLMNDRFFTMVNIMMFIPVVVFLNISSKINQKYKTQLKHN